MSAPTPTPPATAGAPLAIARATVARPLLALLACAALLACSAPVTLAFAADESAVKPRTTLPVIERQVMCVTCKIPLNVAQSPQADRERAFIQGLIDQGRSEGEIKNALVGQYGRSALALPSDHGFDIAAYLVPLAAFLALVAALVVLLPKWRRYARAQAAKAPAEQPLSTSDAARLDADLSRFD
jgi:cytochrome c-type biogenesis protein CcmH